MQRDLVGYSEEQQTSSGYAILDLESINDFEFFSKSKVYLRFQGKYEENLSTSNSYLTK